MPYQPTTNFQDSNGVDLGKKLLTKDYLLSVYGPLLDTLAPGLTFTPALWTWGSNTNGQIGVNDATQRNTPVTTFSGSINWRLVSGGTASSAATKTDGTLWVWGVNSNGQLGINTTADKSTPVTTFAGGTNWRQVSCGNAHITAVKTDGTLWTWGDNTGAELGINLSGLTTCRTTPVTTFAGGTNWKQVSSGNLHTAALKTDGTLWTWGSNTNGQLGDNTSVTRSTPVTTFTGGANWKQVSCGTNYTSAIKTDGTLWTWGSNNNGQLGINTTVDKSTPVTTFSGGTNWKQVACGQNYATAIKTDGTLWTWGQNTNGQLGVNDTNTRTTPVTTFVGGINWKQVDCGQNYATAIKTDGTLWTWGQNTNGQLGVNDTNGRTTPVTTFLGGNNWKQVDCGSTHTTTILSVDYI